MQAAQHAPLYCAEALSVAYFSALDRFCKRRGKRVVRAPKSFITNEEVVKNIDKRFKSGPVRCAGVWYVFEKSGSVSEAVMKGTDAPEHCWIAAAWDGPLRYYPFATFYTSPLEMAWQRESHWKFAARVVPDLMVWEKKYCDVVPR